MRSFLVVTILLLGLSGAAPEYSPRGDELRASRDALNGLIEIESSTRRGDRLTQDTLSSRLLRVEGLRSQDRDLPLRLDDSDIDAGDSDMQAQIPTAAPQPASLDDLCNTLFTSAQDNNLPVPFFANLLWQESRLRDDVVSKKGAQGIAQFMPKVAVETGLANPFDPMQAIPASAHFLQRLRLQFGNLGFVAAAYNAGAHRVIEWLERRASLPRETRDYVVRVTGLSVEAWKTMAIDNTALTFVPHLPCRSLPAFANVEQERLQQAELEHAKGAPAANEQAVALTAADQRAVPAVVKLTHASKHDRVREARLTRESQSSTHGKHEAKLETKLAAKLATKPETSRIARDGHGAKAKPDETHVARDGHGVKAKRDETHVAREGHASKHEAAHSQRGGRERHRSA